MRRWALFRWIRVDYFGVDIDIYRHESVGIRVDRLIHQAQANLIISQCHSTITKETH